MRLTIKEHSAALEYYLGDKMIFTRDKINVKTPDRILSYPILKNGNILTGNFCDIATYSEELIPGENFIKGKITLDIKTDDAFLVQCPFHLPIRESNPYFMIPGFLYGSNNIAKSPGPQHKLNYGGSIDWPNTSLLYTRADRSTHPGIITYNDQAIHLIGIREKMEGVELNPEDPWMPRYAYNGLMIDTAHRNDPTVGFMLGYEHAPMRYTKVWEDPKTPGIEEYRFGWLAKMKGKRITTEVFYYADNASDLRDFKKPLRWYYYKIHQSPIKRSEREEAITAMADIITDETWNKENKTFYVCDNEDGVQQSPIAWTGGTQIAYPLLMAGLRMKNHKYIGIAEEYLNDLCLNAPRSKSGFLYEEKHYGKWTVTGWWGKRENCLNFRDKPLHSGYINGQASYYILKSYSLNNKKYDSWLQTAKGVLDAALNAQEENGYIPCFFDPETGKGVNYELNKDGFMSCWFVPGLALLYHLTADKKYLTAADKAIRYYHTYHQKGELYGTPMDTYNAVDEEGNLAFICGCVELHKATKDDAYLDLVEDGLHYEFSWKFAYNTVFSNDPLRKINWSSCGGSITSTHNPHIHQMGNIITGELYYLYQLTKDEYIAERLRDTCIWGLGSYNVREDDLFKGKKGYSTEQFFHSDGLLLPWWRPHDGGVWEANLPWSSACPLLSCSEDIPDQFFNV